MTTRVTHTPAQVLALLRTAWIDVDRDDITPSEYSGKWVSAFATALRAEGWYGQSSFCVFDRSCLDHKASFGVRELLYDILVAEVILVPAVRGRELRAITGAEWIIESELDPTRSNQVLRDLNKLVVGQARNKMLVVSRNPQFGPWLAKLMPQLLGRDSARVFLAEIPPPGAADRTEGVSLSMLDAGALRSIPGHKGPG